MNQKLSWALVIIVSMIIGGSVVVGIDAVGSDDDSQTIVTSSSDNGTPAVVTVKDTSSVDLADLYDQVRPSIVHIDVQNTRTGTGALGSGIVLDQQGHILTNYHVVNGFDQISVTLADETSGSATIVGSDPGNDLAVLKTGIPGDKLSPARMGDSTKVRVGNPVFAIGNPFGIDGTLTEGVVSAVGRTLSSGGNARPLRQVIQTDAAINEGNSGGGLFNLQGEVIGVTQSLENPSGAAVYAGISYAVPMATVQRFLPDMLNGAQVQHPQMGVSLQDVTPAIAAQLNLPVQEGVLITQVVPGSAAARAGLRGGNGRNGTVVGDVVLSIDDKPVKTYEDLASYIDSKNVGDTISVRVRRGADTTTLQVTLDAWRASA
jgi:S1-C subfamily serine protease